MFTDFTTIKHLIMSNQVLFLENYVSDHFVRIFHPINLTLSILVAGKYKIQDNFITPTTKKYNMTVYMAFALGMLFKIYSTFFKEHLNSMNVDAAIFIFRCILFCLNVIILCFVNVTNSYTNIFLVLKLQRIYMKLYKNKNIDHHGPGNCMHAIHIFYVIIVLRLLLAIATLLTTPSCNISDLASAVLYVGFDVNMFYSIHVINLLTRYLKEWNNHVKEMNDEHRYDEYCKELFEVYQDILESFQLFKDTSQLLVTFLLTPLLIIVLLHTLLYCFYYFRRQRGYFTILLMLCLIFNYFWELIR